MKQTLHLIALRTIRHSDRHNILTGYTLENGRMAFAVNAGAGASAARMRALLMPLSVVECEARIQPGKEVHTLLQVSPVTPLHGIHAHPVKASLALFIAEVLTTLLRDGPADAPLWHYLSLSISTLAELQAARVANFHICFLTGLSRMLGIAPDVTDYRRGMIFDMTEGRFRQSAPLHSRFLTASESAIVGVLARLSYRNMHRWRMSRQERQSVLDGILEYISIHYASLSNLKSLEVVRSL